MEVSGQLHAPAALTPGQEPPAPNVYEAGWAPEPVWTLWRREKSCSCRQSNPGRSARSPSIYQLSHPENIRKISHGHHIFTLHSTKAYITSGTYINWHYRRSHLRSSYVRNVLTAFGWLLMVCRSYQVSWKSVNWFKSWNGPQTQNGNLKREVG
jgi:hypothetical protein